MRCCVVRGPAVDLCHHVISFFSFWAKDKLIRLTCSYNYFCFSSFFMPSLSDVLSASAHRPGCWSQRTRAWNAYLFCKWEEGNHLRFNTIFQMMTEDLNGISQCYLLGRIGHSSVLPRQTDNAAGCLLGFFHPPHPLATDDNADSMVTFNRTFLEHLSKILLRTAL